MKKSKYIFIILFLICSFLVIFSSIKIDLEQDKIITNIENKYNDCKINDYEGAKKEECERFILIVDNHDFQLNFYQKFNNIIIWNLQYFNIIASFVLFVVSLYQITKMFKDRVAVSILLREEKKEFIKRIIKSTYKYILFWVFITILIFICSLINTNLYPSDYGYVADIWNIDLLKKPFLFMFYYLINISLISAFYLNIGLIISRFKHNYIIAVILSFLTIIAVELFFEIGISKIFFEDLLKDYSTGILFNIINMFAFNIDEVGGVLNLLLFSFICFIISFIIVIIVYSNKEKFVNDCLENN